MATPNIIPTIFTAINGLGAPLRQMGNELGGFVRKVEIGAARSERAFNRLAPGFSDGIEKRLGYLKEMGVALAVIGGATYSGKALADYEAEIANLSALTGTAGAELDKFKGKIKDVAYDTRKSSIDVAKAFTTVANAMPELINNADGLGLVTKASITLAKAARMELQPAASALTDILNQFNKTAKESAAVVDLLAAGSKYGSAEISDLQAAIIGFGKIADIGGITLKESVGLTELVSKFKRGSDAGVELRNVLLEMGKNTAQDPKALADLARLGVNIGLIADKTVSLADRLLELKKITYDSNAILHVFGKENSAMAVTVLQNADSLKPLLSKLDDTGVSLEMASKNSNTLIKSLERMRDKWVTIITTAESADSALKFVSGTVGFLTDHMEGLLIIGGTVLGFFTAWKASIFITKGLLLGLTKAQAAFNFVEGIGTVINGKYAVSCFASSAGMRGMAVAAGALEIGLADLAIVGGGVVALLGLLVLGYGHSYDATVKYREENEKMKSGFVQIAEPIKKATLALNEYNNQVREYNDFQNFKEWKKYEHEKGFIRGLGADVYGMFAHPVFTDRAAHERGTGDSILAPKMSDFPGIPTPAQADSASRADSTEQAKKYSYNSGNSGKPIELIITDNTGAQFGVAVNNGNNRANGVKIKLRSTTSSNNRTA